MRTIERSSAFKRDYKREAKGRYRATLDDDLKTILVALAMDQPLDAATAITIFLAIGQAIGNTTSSLTCC